MDTTTLLILIVVVVIATAVLYFIKKEKNLVPADKDNDGKTPAANPETIRLKLQAYERITILTERIGLANLITRFNHDGYSARQLQSAMTDAIKTEYEYNISQQIYVTPKIWDAVNNLKEQNIFIVNQIASALPGNASAIDLSKAIMQYLDSDANASLHSIVLQAIGHEAKQLMQ